MMWEMKMLELAPIWQADTQQQNYRKLLEAMSRPGSVHALQGLDTASNAYIAVLATLLDGSVTLADPHDLLQTSDWPLLQTERVDAETADYLLCDGTRSPGFLPKLGTLPSPEASATLVLAVESLTSGDLGLTLTGPGINGQSSCQLTGLDSTWLVEREQWICGFPLGVDLILVDRTQVMAIPRTTRVEVD
jgi:alpha-D-ribose 1-methylphosphonate 5-triphosphate synthase subunit PhnH